MLCLSFPAGRHDDQVDAIGLVGQLLDTMVRRAKPKQVVRPVSDRWDTERASVNWKTVRAGAPQFARGQSRIFPLFGPLSLG